MGLHVKCPFLQRQNQSVNVNVNAIALFMTRSTLVCFARTAYQAPLLKADLEAVYERNWNLTKLNFLIRLLANPPTGTELQHGQAAKLAVKDMIDCPPRMYNSLQQLSSHITVLPSDPPLAILQKRIFTFNYFQPFSCPPLAGLSFINAGPTIPWNSTLRPHQSWN